MNEAQKASPRDVFLHLLAIIGLYFGTFNLLTLLFQYINVAFPDPLQPNFGVGEAIRFSLAALIIVYPVFIWVSRFLHKDLMANPEKAEFRIRKWLLYFTLFAAALLIIGDLIALIRSFLGGELSVRFLLKVLAVLVVAGSILGYYRYDLRKGTEPVSMKAKWFVWVASAAVIAVIITGFFVAGSPFKQRLVRFDQEKTAHLQTVQWQILNFWQQKDELPQSLEQLQDPLSGFIVPRDPQTNEPYIYRVTGPLAFEICANFNLSSEETEIGKVRYAYPTPPVPPEVVDANWEHGPGEKCFLRTIDPERYRIAKPSAPFPPAIQ